MAEKKAGFVQDPGPPTPPTQAQTPAQPSKEAPTPKPEKKSAHNGRHFDVV
jgi:hypothetical protein